MKEVSWKNLIKAAEAATVKGERIISPFVKGGYVVTVILTDKGNVYTGVNLESKCSLGICSERNAVYKMFEADKNEKMVRCLCFHRGRLLMPCGACREFFMQYGNSDDMEILIEINPVKTVKLIDTMSPWWGKAPNG